MPANLVLQDTTERIFAKKLYADIKHGPGLYIVRGENVLLLGEIVSLPLLYSWAISGLTCVNQDLDLEDNVPEPYKEAPEKEVLALQKEESEKKKKKDKRRAKLLHSHGFEGDLIGDAIL